MPITRLANRANPASLSDRMFRSKAARWIASGVTSCMSISLFVRYAAFSAWASSSRERADSASPIRLALASRTAASAFSLSLIRASSLFSSPRRFLAVLIKAAPPVSRPGPAMYFHVSMYSSMADSSATGRSAAIRSIACWPVSPTTSDRRPSIPARIAPFLSVRAIVSRHVLAITSLTPLLIGFVPFLVRSLRAESLIIPLPPIRLNEKSSSWAEADA